MLIRNIKEFLNLTMNKRIISLDIGKSKIGSAISDQKHLIVTPLFVFSKKNLYSELFKIIKEFNPGAILVGLPLFESEKKNKSCQMIEDITKNIDSFLKNKNNELPIFFWDESYTSFEAEEITKKIFKNSKEQKKKLDKFAAKIIFAAYLSTFFFCISVFLKISLVKSSASRLV